MEIWVILIGGTIIIGVVGYAWASSRHAAQQRRANDRGQNIDSDTFIKGLLQEEEATRNAGAKQGKKHKSHRKEPSMDTADPSSESAIPKQGSLINNKRSEADQQSTKNAPAPQETSGHQQVLVLMYVMARGGDEFRCSGINRILTRVGGVLDERGVFNIRDEQQEISFSVVNALEPATFDRERMDQSSTRGIALFFQTRGTGDTQRFESMMNAARRLSVELDGELLDDKREPLSGVREQRYKSDLAD